MPNNGIISRFANIPNQFLASSVEPTDLVIINTPTTGSKVEQKAVPVSVLGGDTSPYYSYVVNFKSEGGSDAHEIIYNGLPEGIVFDIQYTPGLNEQFRIINNEFAEIQIDFRIVPFFAAPVNLSVLQVTADGTNIIFEDSNGNVFSSAVFYVEFRIYKNTL